jgi:phage tail tape-measure protein
MEDRTKDEEPRNEDPQTMGGAVGGATGAAAAAAAGIAIAGPIGGVIGLLAGAAGGWWGGKELTESIEEVDREDNRFRRAHEHAGATRPYEEIRHAYQLGYLAGRNPDYADATW